MKSFLSNLTVLILSVVFSLAAAELALRVFSVGEAPEIYKEDDILGYVAGSEGEWDANGFRNTEALTHVDIVAMGDSQTLGLNAEMDEAWPQALGRLAGSSAYQMAMVERGLPEHYYLFDNALALNPKVVIVGFYLGNDLLDAYNFIYGREYWRGLRRDDLAAGYEKYGKDDKIRSAIISGGGSQGSKITKIRNWLRAESRLYALLGNASRGLREKLGLAPSAEEKKNKQIAWLKNNPEVGYYFPGAGLETIMSPIYRLDAVNLADKRTAEGFALSKDFLLKMNAKAAEKNVLFITAIIPAKERVYAEYMKAVGLELPAGIKNIADKEAEVVFQTKEFCAENNLRCVDVAPALVSALKNNIKIYPESLDGHPLAAGYEAIAEELLKFIKL